MNVIRAYKDALFGALSATVEAGPEVILVILLMMSAFAAIFVPVMAMVLLPTPFWSSALIGLLLYVFVSMPYLYWFNRNVGQS